MPTESLALADGNCGAHQSKGWWLWLVWFMVMCRITDRNKAWYAQAFFNGIAMKELVPTVDLLQLSGYS